MITKPWPDPNAPRTVVDSFVRENASPPPPPAHEAPAVENGPSVMCTGCNVVRISLRNELGLCKSCREAIGA